MNTQPSTRDPLANLTVAPPTLPEVPEVSATAIYVATFLGGIALGRIIRTAIRRARAA